MMLQLWIIFALLVVTLLSIDTFYIDKRTTIGPHASIRASLLWTIFWIGLAFLFNGFIWTYYYYHVNLKVANQQALDFFAGYLIEKSLSIDNLFVFYMIFHHLHIPLSYQRRVFAIGIWSAIVFRLIFILLGSYMVARYHWLLYLMGAFLIFTGIKMLFEKGKKEDIEELKLIKYIKKIFRTTNEIVDNHFFVLYKNKWYATRLFIALILIECSDIIFAFDSVPAIFAITRDPFIVWSSNVFAILGLRSLYFILANMINRFKLLKYGIAMILVFVGTKMVIEPWLHITTVYSLAVIISILVSFIFMSLLVKAPKKD